jgi:hypothetical protein
MVAQMSKARFLLSRACCSSFVAYCGLMVAQMSKTRFLLSSFVKKFDVNRTGNDVTAEIIVVDFRKWYIYGFEFVLFGYFIPLWILINGFITILRRRVPLVEQELLILPEHMSSPPVKAIVMKFLTLHFNKLHIYFFFDVHLH